MTFGLGSYALAWAIGMPGYTPEHPMDVFEFVECAAKHKFKLVQIADNLPLHMLKQSELERLKQLSQDLDIDIEVGTRGIANGNLEHYLDFAQYFNSPILRVVVDSAGHEPEHDEIIQAIAEIVPQFEQAQIALAIENHDRFKAQELLKIVSVFNSPYVGVCLDTVNSFGALEGPEWVIRTFKDYVVNVHIKDFKVVREPHNLGFIITGTPAGQGMLNIPRLIDTFSKKREITGILELWPAPENTLTDTIAKEARWLEESALFLQKLT